jgi:NADH:ubiquinone oxidoreductase subunit F (NADH-binding)
MINEEDIRERIGIPFFHPWWSQLYEENTIVNTETTIVVAMVVILYTGRRWFVTVGCERNDKRGGHP